MNALTVLTIETASLGDRSYLVHDGTVAFVVDPQRDIDRVLDLLREHRVELTHVFETHIHNDYVTGGLALARATGADYLVNEDDDVTFERTPVRDGQTVPVGDRMRVTALATPGHTFTHLSYALDDAGTGETVGVFSGGSLLYGATGRPDLLGAEHTHDLVHLQHASAHRLAELLPDDAGVFPTHGFGSFCSATQSDATESTIGQEKQTNPVLTQDEETYVRELLDGLGAWPAYYVHMAPANASGPDAPDLSLPARADAGELRQRIEAGEWVVDLRNRTAFAAGHAPGSLNFGLDGAFSTYLGWLIPWGTPVTLLGETVEAVAEAQRELVRIGIDRPAAHATGGPEDWTDGERRDLPHRRRSPTSPRCATTARWSCSTSAATRSTTPPGSPVRSTSRSTSCRPGSARSRPARCGSTAPAATAPPSRPPSCRGRPDPRGRRRHLRQRGEGRPAPGGARGVTLAARRRRGPPDRAQPGRARWRRLDPRRPGAGLPAGARARPRPRPARWWWSG